MRGITELWAGCVVGALAFACGEGPSPPTGPTPPERPEPLAPLPAPASLTAGQFADSARCAQCHVAVEDDADAVRDAMGRDVSPVTMWRPSMMAMAARDPFYLAAWNEERSRYPSQAEKIDRTCSRCHAPMGHVLSDGALSFEDVVAGDSDSAELARDGVSCAACHQIRPENLGREASFSGGFEIGNRRQMFGPHEEPDTGPMQAFLDFTPVYAPHILSSELCATCHTVIVSPLADDGSSRGIEITEQATYFEWLNSDYSSEESELALSCAACHLPTFDEEDNIIRAPIATNPGTLDPREPFGRHLFVGGGVTMSRLLLSNLEWAGLADSPEVNLAAAAVASERHLATAAALEVVSATRDASSATLAIRVDNRTGHKLPTGYPSRRMWLHVVARDLDGAVVFESGAVDALGALIGEDPSEVREHLDVVDSPDQVVVWEAVLVDDAGRPTHRPLGAVRYEKDTRLLPLGFSTLHPQYERMSVVGVGDDSNHIAGSDTVTFEISTALAIDVDIELLYQSLPPHHASAHEEWPTPAGVRFSEMVAAEPPLPTVMATTSASIP